ncbi:DUF262 domain-containing protein [Nakamurella flavida]|uniref:DUF262 domain-containing protein n=1 Tax=Nakamurella flavida TaxID=363630 RepID=A0A938YJU3_9ACTN|nr:DUF262 domain-containing protein [Nakamurella flavida]MBM9476469.1 DUF262 domain-containing protein [Nakamurella flavida]MDP9779430.1 hypothetical protein [Nakamurella flavida]
MPGDEHCGVEPDLPITLFKDTTYTLSGLIGDIRRGEVALPDIQRPFVWPAAKVRDLFDSMYRGFPVGYLLFWETGAGAGTRQIGTDVKQAAPRLLIVDGQQRLTSLFAVLTGTQVVREDYTEWRIRIAFRPTDATFSVADAAIEKDPEFIPDVSALWGYAGRKKTVRAFLDRLRTKRDITQAEEDRLDDAIDRLYDLHNYPFKVVELSPDVDEEQVAEVFVRINSEGVKLNRADFILTLMSVFWDKGRAELEDFCRAAKQPSIAKASPFNWFIQPQPPQLLRVSVALAFRRAVLKTVYTLLRGKDLDTGQVSVDKRDEQFRELKAAQEHVLSLTNWHEFLQCLERAGYRSGKMVTSESAVLYSYGLWLIGRVDYGMSVQQLREVIARWFFMVQVTGRYTGSFESQVESDLARFANLNTADGFIEVLDRIVDDTLSADYWSITLPNDLATSASRSPALSSYIAALNILDADALMGTGKVRSRLDPAIVAQKGIERHHLFPKGYLREALKITDTKQVNQIANMALVEWADNIAVSDDPPAKYWPAQVAARNFGEEKLAEQMRLHALPDGWTEMTYGDFLVARRKLMGAVVHDAFAKLRNSSYTPSYPQPSKAPTATSDLQTHAETPVLVSLAEMIEQGLVASGAVLLPADSSFDVLATVLDNGDLEVEGQVYETPTEAAVASAGFSVDGWHFWLADGPSGPVSLAHLAAG